MLFGVVGGYAFSQEEHGIMSQVVSFEYAPFYRYCFSHWSCTGFSIFATSCHVMFDLCWFLTVFTRTCAY